MVTPGLALAAFAGVAWGILGGALPGISPSITMALLLPFTYGLDPTNARLITELVGKYATNYPVLAAAGVIALIPPAIVALVLNRQIRGVLTGSS